MSEIKIILKRTVFYLNYLILKSIINNFVAYLILGLEPFNINDFKVRKTSNSVYIVGSGASLNEAYKDLYTHINNNDSIGFNYSLLLDLDPTYHLLEFPLDTNSDKMLKLSKMKSNTLFIVKDIEYSLKYFIKSGFYKKLRSLDKRYFSSNQIYLPHSNPTEVDRFLKKYLNYNKLISAKGTLFMSLVLAYLLGYKVINLIGVDLYDSNYFYEDEEFKAINKNIIKLIPVYSNNDVNRTHATNTDREDSLSITKLITYFYREYLLPNKIDLQIYNKKSPLYESINKSESLSN